MSRYISSLATCVVRHLICWGIEWYHFIKDGHYKDRKGTDLTEAEDIKKKWQENTGELSKKDLHDPHNHSGVITHLEPTSWKTKSCGPTNKAVATRLEKSFFIPIPQKGNAKECSNNHTIALISNAFKVILKILQSRLQQCFNCELPDVQARFWKSSKTEIKLATSIASSKKKDSSRKTTTSALFTMPKPLTVWITSNCGNFFKRWE